MAVTNAGNRRKSRFESKHRAAMLRNTGMTASADYARAAAYLDRARLPAYVSFIEQASARGLASGDEAPQRIYVRISDGKIVSGVPPANAHVVKTTNGDSDNPFRLHEFFDPHCYAAAAGENLTHWNGEAALRIELQPACKDDAGFRELYVDPQTLRPIAADGTMPDEDSHMNVAIELRYTTVGQYTVPSEIRAHAVGRGWLFWARERAEVDYTDYRFLQKYEVSRKQASVP